MRAARNERRNFRQNDRVARELSTQRLVNEFYAQETIKSASANEFTYPARAKDWNGDA